MPKLRSIVKKVGATIAVYGQILLVFLAFTLMVILSYIYVKKMMLSRLEDAVNTSLDFMQVSIESDLAEPEKLLQSVSQSIRNMIINGYGPDLIQKYLKEDMSPNVVKYDKRKLGINRMYGYFEAFKGLQLINGEWEPSDDNLKESPWYKAAVEANGKVVFATPYFNARIRSYVLTYSRQIFDGDKPMAVIAIDVPIDKIIDYVIEMHVTEGGYGMLVDENLGIIAHPDVYLIGKPLRNVNSGMASYLAYFLENSGEAIPKSTATNYKGMESIVFSRKLRTGWYVSLIAPVNKYYREVRRMGLVLTVLGMIMAAVLSVILWSINNSKKKVEEENRQKSDFLAKMSHEIRTPMNAILGITEIQLQNSAIPLAVREGLERIYNSGDLLLGIINDILDLSKIEAGKLELINAQYDISSLIHDIVKLNIIRYESKAIEFKLNVSEDIPTFLIGDELRIKQILNNLLSNAFKYTDEGLVELSLFTEPIDNNSSVMLVFRVSDTGQGMTPDDIKKLGDKFGRFNLEANRKTEGAGLGMNITRNLIQLMNGSITIESAPGAGSVFVVKLPQECADRNPIGKELADNLEKLNLKNVTRIRKLQIKQDFMPYGRVLVVDDVETNLYVARGLLAPYGLSIDIAMSGFEAVDKIRGGAKYDIIFMDHMMPKMDGIEAAKIIRSLDYKGAVVALTANAIMGQAEMFLSNGFDDFISKPIDIRQLNAVLNKLIRDKQPAEVIDEARRQKNVLYASGRHHIAIDPQLAEYFVRDGEKAYSILDNILKNNFSRSDDLLQYVINVHAMKSSLANIGEGELSDKALELEQAGRDQNINLIIKGLPEFLISLRHVIDKLKPPDEITEEIKIDNEDDLAFLREKLQAIQAACVSFDKKSAKEILAEVKEKTWSKATRDRLSAITEHLLHSEFEEAAAIAGEAYSS